jgi:hypothetical protein
MNNKLVAVAFLGLLPIVYALIEVSLTFLKCYSVSILFILAVLNITGSVICIGILISITRSIRRKNDALANTRPNPDLEFATFGIFFVLSLLFLLSQLFTVGKFHFSKIDC